MIGHELAGNTLGKKNKNGKKGLQCILVIIALNIRVHLPEELPDSRRIRPVAVRASVSFCVKMSTSC